MAESSTNMCSSTNEEFGEEANVITMVDVLKEEQELEDDAKAVLGGSDDQNCTYSKGYVKRQALYACMTCIPLGDDAPPGGICLACSYFCHEGHELVELYTKRNFRCDCGNSRFNNNKCNLEPNKDDMNELNNYNQNFRGVYCTCSRPYPDPEDNTEDEMIQCIVCEDWYHGRHLASPVPALNDYGEMVCGTCMEKHPFLWHYKGFAATIVSPEEATTSKVEVVKSEVENGVVYPANTNGLDKPEMKLDTVVKQECYIKDLSLAADLQGAVFFSEGWRKQLCTCTKCQELYEFQKVSFLLDEQDTVQAYEEKGKAKGEAGQPASQYEQGLKALSSLDRIKQVEAIEVAICKDKWRNSRDRWARYLRQTCVNGSAATAKTPYYLADYLAFLTPFPKSRSQIGNLENLNVEEQPATAEEHSSPLIIAENSEEESTQKMMQPLHQACRRSTKRGLKLDVDEIFSSYLQMKTKPLVEIESENSDVLFFRSLLPDVAKLSPADKSAFKLFVQQKLNDMLYR